MSSAARSGRGRVGAIIALLLVVVVAASVWLIVRSHGGGASGVATTAPAQPTTHPTTQPATQPAGHARARPSEPAPMSYGQVVRANVPGLPTTQPLPLPLDLPQAAHLILKDPLFLDARRNLWLTRHEAPPTATVLATPNPESEYVVPERVLFVHWAPDDQGLLAPQLIVPQHGGSGVGFDLVTAKLRVPIEPTHAFQWDRARSWDDRILVPSATGVSVFHFEHQPGGIGTIAVEQYQELAQPKPDGGRTKDEKEGAGTTLPVAATTRPSTPVPQLLFDGQGFLAWIPWENDQPGGRGAARYVDGKWLTLGAEQGWPEHLLHLIPLIGGSVMQLVAGDHETVKLGVSELGGGEPVDRKAVEKLVDDLSSATVEVRDKAFAQLTRYGPSVRPLLREMLEDQPPEGQARLRQLLKEQVQPLLGPLTLLGDKLRLISRHPDGGAVFYADAGVSLTTPDGDPVPVVPAWLAIRPGKSVQVLPEGLVRDLNPETAQVLAVPGHDDDWVVEDGVQVPRRFFGNGFTPLLRKSEMAYSDLIGVDRRGRWIFRKPATAQKGARVETLVLDPTFLDATPRLPVWNYTTADEVGWDKDNWPLVRQGGAVFRLTEDGWQAIEKTDELLTRPDQVPPPPAPTTAPTTRPAPATRSTTRMAAAATTEPTTGPTTKRAPTTEPAVADDSAKRLGAPLLVTADGTRYFGGVTDLHVISPDGTETIWTLPDIANGNPPDAASGNDSQATAPPPDAVAKNPHVTLIRTADGTLFLFNQPGRVLRIKPTPAAAEPFTIDATFTRNIPSVDAPTRIWLDPAERIIIAADKTLAICFPAGYIPKLLREKMANPDDAEAVEP